MTALALSSGCIVAPIEAPDELAERYAREETQLIDEQSFQQARERNRLQHKARERAMVASLPPLEIDPTVTGRWQFGTLQHPLHGEPVCAAFSGIGGPPVEPGTVVPRLVVLGDGAWITSAEGLATDRPESAVRIDGGLPIPLEFSPDGHSARLTLATTDVFARLRVSSVATLDFAFDSSSISDGLETTIGNAQERFIEIDSLDRMLDEIERCGLVPGSADGADAAER